MAAPDEVLTAFRTRLQTVAVLPVLRYWENVIPASQATNKDAYTQDSVQMGTKTPMSLPVDATGRRWWRWQGGLYRVTLHYPANTHMHVPLSVAEAVAQAFYNSSLVTLSGLRVTIESVRIPASTGDATGVSVPVEIRFRFEQFDA
jgi:hypothetical protein